MYTNGFCPLNRGWSKAGCRWEITQSIISPSGLCISKTNQQKKTQNKLYINRTKDRASESKFQVKLVHTWIVLRAGLLMFSRRALMNLSFCNSLCGRRVWLAAWRSPFCSDAWAWDGEEEEEEETSTKNTRMGMIGDKILLLHQLEAIFEEFLVCFVESGCCCFVCVLHWRCLLLWYSKHLHHHNNLFHLGFVVHENISSPTTMSIQHITTILRNYLLSHHFQSLGLWWMLAFYSSLSFWGSSRASNTLVFMFWQLQLLGTSWLKYTPKKKMGWIFLNFCPCGCEL